MRYRAASFTCVLVLAVFGCGGGSGGGPTGPAEATLEIIASTTGSGLDPDGYTLSVDNGASQLLPSNGADTVASLSPGTHTVTLAGVAANCHVGGANPRSIDIAAGSTTSLRFEVTCTEPPAAISVHAVTTGDDLDPDGYQIAVDGGTAQPLSINGSVLISGLTQGDHELALSNVAENCAISGTNPLTVAVLSGSTTNVRFTVSCSAPLTPPGRDIALQWDGEVYLLSADGTTFSNLTNNPGADAEPTWSPDGQKIAFVSIRAGRDQIFVMNADGSGQTQLTTNGDYFAISPAWSPDGGKIAFGSNSSGTFEIYVMNPDGSDITQLTNANAREPAWSPDGSKIAFVSDRTGTERLYMMNPDGTEQVPLTAGSSATARPAWRP